MRDEEFNRLFADYETQTLRTALRLGAFLAIMLFLFVIFGDWEWARIW